MEPLKNTMNKSQTQEVVLVDEEEVQELKKSLPKATFMGSNLQLVKFEGFWCPPSLNLKNVLMFRRNFHARDTDLIIASLPKTGTTWLKALLFVIVNRFHHKIDDSPLLTHHPHELVYRLEKDIYGEAFTYPSLHHFNELPSPRLLHTHLPYASLPKSIKTSQCRILYISRNPLDTYVSQLNFYPNVIKKQMGEDFQLPCVEDFFEDCYEGRVPYGPFFDHVVGYWNQSLEKSEKVLFLKYEDLKDDAISHLKRLAKFVGMPFSSKEESDGVIQNIIDLCSINNLKQLEVNKNGVLNKFFEKNTFFRKGEVGDWTNFFTPSMVEKMNKLMEEQLWGTGLSYKLLSH